MQDIEEVKRDEKLPKIQSPDLNESVIISEVSTNETVDELKKDKFQTVNAKPNMIPNESIGITESLPNETLSDLTILPTSENKANVNIITHEAKIITENLSNQNESELLEQTKPLEITATSSILPNNEIQVTEVNKAESEDKFVSNLKAVPVKPKYQLDEVEGIEVSEVISGDVPEEYKPKSVIATETASESLIEHKTRVTEETNATESEDVFNVNKMPTEQNAERILNTMESVSVTQYDSEEKEKPFDGKPLPTLSHASDVVSTMESITSEIVDIQDSLENLKPAEHDKKKAKLEFSENLAVSTSIPQINESETLLDDMKPADSKIADTSIICLESTQLEETITNENVKDFTGKLEYNTFEATEELLLQESTEVGIVLPQEKESELKIKALPENASAKTLIDTEKSLIVTEQDYSEKEQQLESFTPFENQTANVVPDTLQSIVIEETNVEDGLEDISKLEPKSMKAKLINEQREETSVSETVAYEQTSDYTDLLKSVEKTASANFEPIQGISTTETFTENQANEMNDFEYSTKSLEPTSIVQPQQIAVKSEVNAECVTSNIDDKEYDTKKANVEQTYSEGISVNAVDVREPEESFAKTVLPDARQASVNYESLAVPTTTEVVCQDSTESIDISQAVEKLANVESVISESLQINEVNLIESESQLADSIKPDEKTATFNIDTQSAAIISEVIPNDNSQPLLTTSNIENTASVNQIESQALIVEQTQISESEIKLDEYTTPDSKSAFTNYEALTAPINTETITSDNTESLDIAKTELKQANLTQPYSEGLIINETICSENEVILKDDHKEDLRNAFMNYESLGVPITTETLTNDTIDINTDKTPLGKNAQPNVEEYIASQQTEIITNDTIKNIETTITLSEQKGETKFENANLIAKSEIVTCVDSVQKLEENIPDSQNVKVIQETFTTAIKSEVNTNENVDTYIQKQKPDARKASIAKTSNESVIISEVELQETVQEMKTPKKTVHEALKTQQDEHKLADIQDVNVKQGKNILLIRFKITQTQNKIR